MGFWAGSWEDGTRITACQGADGRFHDVDDGLPVARLAADDSGKQTVTFSTEMLRAWTEQDPDPDPDPHAAEAVKPNIKPYEDGSLCPKPSKDNNIDDGNFDNFYQEHIGAYENPGIQPPIPSDLAYAFPVPDSLQPAMIDHCRQRDGALIDAKARYAHLLIEDWGLFGMKKKFEKQLERQIATADLSGHRAVVWDCYDMATVHFVRNLVRYSRWNNRVSVHQVDYPGDSRWPYPKNATWAKGLQKSMTFLDAEQQKISVFWNSRPETVEQIAGRLTAFVDPIAPLHQAFSNWILGGMDEPEYFDDVRHNFTEAVAVRVTRDDFDEPDANAGYDIPFLNNLTKSPENVGFSGTIGALLSIGHITFQSAWFEKPSRSIVSHDVWIGVFSALIECFDAEFGEARSNAVLDMNRPNQLFNIGWMTYVPPSMAGKVTPPSSALVHRLSNGGIILSATKAPLDPRIPAHLAAAESVLAALAPVQGPSVGDRWRIDWSKPKH